MNSETNLRTSSSASVSPQLHKSPSQSIFDESSARHRTSAVWLIPCAVLAILALALAADAFAQQPYSGAPYDNPSQAGQYLQPAPQNSYAPPQYQPSAPQQPYPDQTPQYAPQYAPQQQPYGDQQPNSEQAPPDESQAPAQSLSAQDLEQLLAPIALYPDSLLAQILAASTYPAQVAVADQWLQQMRAQGYSSPDQIAAGANAQTNWDPSIKALTAFPDVMDMMNHDLRWTSNLGNAYYNQPQDVMQTVQVLRDRAEQAGNLQSTPQEEVNDDQGYVELQPTNPEVVYVPTYNPWHVYGEPIAPYPGFAYFGGLGDFYGGAAIQYGLSFALGAFDRMPFGWTAWGCDWAGQGLMFNHSGYYTRSNQVADWGLARGGPRSRYGRGGYGGMRDGQNRSYDQRPGYNRGGGNQRGDWQNNRGGSSDRGGRGGDQSYARPAQGFPEPGRRFDYSNRGPQQRGNEYTQPSQSYYRTSPGYSRTAPEQNYGYRSQTDPNRSQTYPNRGYQNRTQNYGNPGNGYGYTGRSNYGYTGPQTYATRPGFGYSSPSRSYRAPQPDYSRGYSSRSNENYGNAMTQNQRSGGFHLFGGGQSRSFGNQRAPSNSYRAPQGFGGGHQSFGGGHPSFGGGHQNSGGGHPSFGGGHQSSGGGHRR
jgi:hypothetical protein